MTGRRLRDTLRACPIAVALLASPGAARAQTTVNPGALDQLAPAPAPAPSPAPQPARKQSKAKPAGKTAAKSDTHAAAKPAKPAPPVVPKAAPPAPVLPPPIVVPTRPTPPVVTPPAVKDAPGEATRQKDGLRVTFGVGRADLNPASDAAVRAVPHTAPGSPAAARYLVTAYAGGNADDPSTPRRLALSRALAVRSLLLAEGAQSANITVRALGPPPADDASPDRVDIAVTAAPVEPTSAATPAPAPASGPQAAPTSPLPAPAASGTSPSKRGQGR